MSYPNLFTCSCYYITLTAHIARQSTLFDRAANLTSNSLSHHPLEVLCLFVSLFFSLSVWIISLLQVLQAALTTLMYVCGHHERTMASIYKQKHTLVSSHFHTVSVGKAAS